MTARNAFSVDVEEYFQVEAFSSLIPKGDWDRLPARAEEQEHQEVRRGEIPRL